MDNKLSLDATLEGAIKSLMNKHPDISGVHLDIGSGTGNLIRRIQQEYNVQSFACDYTRELMEIDDIIVDVVDLNEGKLPYEDNFFDLVTFTEVVEHLENYRAIIREINRILKIGGVLIITTPNILNMKSRLRFFTTGFWSMFGPLHVGETAIESTGGHITPIAYPYLAHALMNSGFEMPTLTTDKFQSPSIVWAILFFLPILLISSLQWKKERNKYKTIDQFNAPIITKINKPIMLLGRSIIVITEKVASFIFPKK